MFIFGLALLILRPLDLADLDKELFKGNCSGGNLIMVWRLWFVAASRCCASIRL